MMIKNKNFNISTLVFVCMLTDVLIRPLYSAVLFNAKSSILYTLAATLLTIIISSFLISSKINLLNNNIIRCLLYFLFLASAAQTLVKTEQFYRYVSSEALPLALFILCVLVVGIYAACMPKTALVRLSGAVVILALASIAFMFLSNLSQMKIQNLSFEFSQKFPENLFFSLNFAPEIFLFLFATSEKSTVKFKNFTVTLLSIWLVFSFIAIAGELVLGSAYYLQSQPAHTLARLGSISVFKRLDGIFATIWTLLAVIKFSAFFAFACKLNTGKSIIGVKLAIQTVITLILIGLFYPMPAAILRALITVSCIILLVILTVYLCIVRERVNEKAV